MNGGRPVRVTAKLRSELNAARSARSARRKGETTALAAKEMEQAGPVPYHEIAEWWSKPRPKCETE